MRISGEHLLTLINDILDVGKIEAQKMDIEQVVFDLPALVHQSLNLTRLKADEKGLCFLYEELSPLPPYVRGDERKLRQILLNLLSNAVKNTLSGSVTLRVFYDYVGGGTFRCDVVDTGTGIPAEKLESIFEPFTQLADRCQSREGVGLGLNITRRLLELMDGRLSVESTVGEGSLFRLELALPPITDQERTCEKTDCSTPGFFGERKRIPVVDENADNASTLGSGGPLPPPSSDLYDLLNLAQRGDMLGVESWAARLEERDARYRNFAGKLRELARSFKTKAVLALVKQCRGEEI
jgi:hypothetical protein